MKLSKLEIHKYRVIRPGAKLVFGEGIHLLIGKNGTGKTTLLDLLAMIFGCNFSPVAHEEFSLEYQFHHVFGIIDISVRNWAEKERVDERNVADDRRPSRRIGTMDRPIFRYELSITLVPAPSFEALGFRLNATNASTTVEYDDGSKEQWDIPVSPFPEGNFLNYVFKRQRHASLKSPEQRKEWRFPRGVARLDESVEWFRKVLAEGSIAREEYFDEYMGQSGYYQGRPDLCPAEIAIRLNQTAQGSEVVNGVVVGDDELAFLQKTVRALGYEQATLHFELKKSTHLDSNYEYYGGTSAVHFSRAYYGNFRFVFAKRDGSRIPHNDLSFGEKRLLAFHYYLATYDHVLIADELANGMHHDMIDRCVDALADRQVFLSTQNPLLLDHLGFSSADEVRASFILCHIVTEQHREQMVLRNMTADESAEFFADYRVGIQHVNEVLRARGLW